MGRRKHLSVCAALVAAALVAAALAGAAIGDDAATKIRRDPEFVAEVNAAIRSGMTWVLSRESGDVFREDEWAGFDAGVPALACYTLRVCGVRRDDPRMDRCLADLKSRFYAHRAAGTVKTYTTALMCLAAAVVDDVPQDAGRTSDGGVPAARALDLAWLRDMARWLERAQSASGGWTYGESQGSFDHSNTHFALLGLRAASNAGVRVRPTTWERALQCLVAAQEREGPRVRRAPESSDPRATRAEVWDRARGWGYGDGGAAYGSMTAGSVASLAICLEQLRGAPVLGTLSRADVERATDDGLAWLGFHFEANRNPRAKGAPGWPTVYYWLYGVERAGVLTGRDWMADVDWYGRGARYLIDAQDARGFWPTQLPGNTVHPRDAMPSTCCALLFLKRGTVRGGRPAPAASTGEAGIDFEAARTLGEKDFEDVVSSVVERWTRFRGAPQRDALALGCAVMGVRAVDSLIDRLESEAAATREAAASLLVAVTGVSHGAAPDESSEDRSAAAARWRKWLVENASALRLDAATGRLVVDRGR